MAEHKITLSDLSLWKSVCLCVSVRLHMCICLFVQMGYAWEIYDL